MFRAPASPHAPLLPAALYRAAQVHHLDGRAMAEGGIPGATLMARAGAAAFSAARRRWPVAQYWLVVCGAGNNAGDGYVMARLALEGGLTVAVAHLAPPATLKGDAFDAFEAAAAAGVPVAPFDSTSLDGVELVVDALLGIGTNRPVEGVWREAIEAINDCPAPVLALDIPSGLHPDSGQPQGVAVRADFTMSFVGLKRGLFTGSGRHYSGTVAFADLGIPPHLYREEVPAALLDSGQDLAVWLPSREPAAHKGRYGHVLVVGGDVGMAGAPRLAAQGAARAGAGLVSVATRPAHAPVQAAVVPEVMFRGVDSPADLRGLLRRATVVALGPGLGQEDWGLRLWEAALTFTGPLVVDADGLNLLTRRPRRREDWILTPHPGEAARLLGMEVSQVEADRFAAAEALHRRYGGVVVLKGAGTLVVAEGQCWVCRAGNPGMASGGMGDVLTGIIAGLWAQGLPPAAAARVGVFVHAAAADEVAAERGQRGLMASDLFAALGAWVNP